MLWLWGFAFHAYVSCGFPLTGCCFLISSPRVLLFPPPLVQTGSQWFGRLHNRSPKMEFSSSLAGAITPPWLMVWLMFVPRTKLKWWYKVLLDDEFERWHCKSFVMLAWCGLLTRHLSDFFLAWLTFLLFCFVCLACFMDNSIVCCSEWIQVSFGRETLSICLASIVFPGMLYFRFFVLCLFKSRESKREMSLETK